VEEDTVGTSAVLRIIPSITAVFSTVEGSSMTMSISTIVLLESLEASFVVVVLERTAAMLLFSAVSVLPPLWADFLDFEIGRMVFVGVEGWKEVANDDEDEGSDVVGFIVVN
jgi:hypothetical protein